MGLDNVLAVAGAAQGSFLLVVLGLLISIPVVIWGRQLILKYSRGPGKIRSCIHKREIVRVLQLSELLGCCIKDIDCLLQLQALREPYHAPE